MSSNHDKFWDSPKKEKIRKKTDKQEKPDKKDFIVSDKKELRKLLKEGYFLARVTEVQKKYVFIAPEKSPMDIDTVDVWLSTVAKKFLQNQRSERNFIVVGDKVLCLTSKHKDSEDFPQATIEGRLERKSQISRVDPIVKSREHILASNIDQLVVMASYLNPQVRWGLIDRFLVQAEHEHLDPVIFLNKADLLPDASDSFKEECEREEKIYRDLGYKVITFDALRASSLKQPPKILRDLFRDKLTLIAGHSGVGKSSITNLLKPEIEQDVEELEIFRKGRHTTTYTSLLKLEKGGFIIDTPGIRSFTLPDIDPITLSWGFVEMRPFLNKCRYRGCKHHDEPECRITEAVKEGTISKRRYESYINLLLNTQRREGRYTLEP